MIQVELIPEPVLKGKTKSLPLGNYLCIFYYNSNPPPKFLSNSPVPVFWVPMKQFGSEILVEVWSTPSSIEYKNYNNIKIACTDEMIVFELQQEVEPFNCNEHLSKEIFETAFQILKENGYLFLLKIWNYLPYINSDILGLESYRRFCIGRQRAFEEYDPNFQLMLSASSALGINSNRFSSIFLASKVEGVHVENPRQISAFNYPKQYGPKSPSFARATVKMIGGTRYVFVSGTASIVGHESLHVGNLREQIKEILLNIKILLEEIRKKEIPDGYDVNALIRKVYVRNADDIPFVQCYLNKLNENSMDIYLNGDICRRDLLLEIEGVWVVEQNE